MSSQLTETDSQYVPPDYDFGCFPKPSLTADVVVLSSNADGIEVLLIERGGHPFKRFWALPGGFAEQNETITQTATRELHEETGVTQLTPRYFGVYSTPGRDPRGWVVSVAFFAVVKKSKINPQAGDDARNVKWCSVDELPELAFDHNQIIEEAVQAFMHD